MNTMPNWRDVEEMRTQLTARALEDSDFRDRLVSDPKAMIEREFGVQIPDNVQIRIHSSDMQTLHFALPPRFEMTELSEEQLEGIAAGLCCCIP